MTKINKKRLDGSTLWIESKKICFGKWEKTIKCDEEGLRINKKLLRNYKAQLKLAEANHKEVSERDGKK